jgi:hypothetical protein
MNDATLPHFSHCFSCGCELDAAARARGHAACPTCYRKHQEEPEPTAVEILAMDLADLQDDTIELFRRLSGKPQNEDQEEVRRERKERFERMLRLVQAVAGGAREEKRG